MKLYLAHPVEKRHWIREQELICEKDTKIELINPFYDLIRPEIIEIDKGNIQPMDESLDYISIVNRDLLNIYESDAVIAFIGEEPSIGTTCEIWFAISIGRPVYIITEKFGMHPWIRYATKISNGRAFKNFDEFKEYIINTLKIMEK